MLLNLDLALSLLSSPLSSPLLSSPLLSISSPFSRLCLCLLLLLGYQVTNVKPIPKRNLASSTPCPAPPRRTEPSRPLRFSLSSSSSSSPSSLLCAPAPPAMTFSQPLLLRALLALVGSLCLGLLALSGAAQEPYWADLQPRSALVERGGSLWLNCSTNCPRPERGGLETSLRRNGTQRGLRWLARQLVDIREPEAHPICFFRCARRTLQARGTILTYQRPDRVELEPLPAWLPVGENFTLSCRVPGAGPRGSLSVALLRGAQELSRRRFPGESPRARGAMATFRATARKEDHRANFSCLAELDLRPHGLGLLQNSSTPQELHTFALAPGPPSLAFPRLLEVGSEQLVSCEMDKLFPAEEAHIQLALGSRMLNPQVVLDGDKLRAAATLIVKEEEMEGEGEQELTCTVTLGGQDRKAQENLTVYSFPQPNLKVSEPSVREGTFVNVTCEARPGAQVRLDGAPEPPPGEPAWLTLTASEEDDERVFTCEALLEVKGEILRRNQSLELQVLYGPRLDEAGCPGNWTWLEGMESTLQCWAPGNPPPVVECIRPEGGPAIPLGLPLPISRDHAGTYQCTASNTVGQTTKDVMVMVEYGPVLDQLGCPERRTWLEGTEEVLTCQALGVPPPTVSCIPTGSRAWLPVGQLQVTREHAGTYHCVATNPRGSASTNVSVTVEYAPSFGEVDCPGAWTWVKGSDHQFSCEADGNPEPVVLCLRAGNWSHEELLFPHLGSHLGHDPAPGLYYCNATNMHGSASKTVTISAESPPEMDEASCPSHQTWLEGTQAPALTCRAQGNPTPRVQCSREGPERPEKPSVSRADAGIFHCVATNSHGSDTRMVTIGVEYRPLVAELVAMPPGSVKPGGNFTLTCRAEGSPPAQYSWRTPPGAPNIGLSGNNSTLSVAGALGSHGGVYECAATNTHGSHALRITVHVAGPWLWIVVGGVAGGALLLASLGGLTYYLQSTACKKGEYNVQEAESSGEAVCLNGSGAGTGAGGGSGTGAENEAGGAEVYSIQLTAT
ncbi:LOW QUALITY PROTEIN: intercellular adhesion molecule 5 [Vombatus ursinus]|nr:LOW QUALITY PROTEIN: intercellular adhesion molecule 5 [Vombatus ursinus]